VTLSGVVGDWCVELSRRPGEGGTSSCVIYGYATEQEAQAAVQGWLKRWSWYREGTVRRRREEETETMAGQEVGR